MFPAAAVIWPIVRDNWKIIVAGLAIAGLAGYIWFLKAEVKHYRAAAANARAELAAAVAREEKLQLASEGITAKYKDALVETKKLVEENAKLLEEAIQHDKELNTLRVSYAAVGLFNASKRAPGTAAPKAVKGDDGKAGSADPAGTTNGIKRSVPLSEIFALVARNDANHWKCVKQVENWQSFWTDYETAYKQATGG